MLKNLISGKDLTEGVTPYKASSFKYFSYDTYPINCGDSEDACGNKFYANLRFVHKFVNDGVGCAFYDCTFDYEFPKEDGPEGSWVTFKITGDTIPTNIREGSGLGCSCPIDDTDGNEVSINEALEDEKFANMIFGTGTLGEIADINLGDSAVASTMSFSLLLMRPWSLILNLPRTLIFSRNHFMSLELRVMVPVKPWSILQEKNPVLDLKK